MVEYTVSYTILLNLKFEFIISKNLLIFNKFTYDKINDIIFRLKFSAKQENSY